MSGVDEVLFEITPQVLLKAYACGIFPMAESASDPGMFWVEPEVRGILPLESFHIPASLKKTMRKNTFSLHIDRDFDAVIKACAEKTENRDSTWINDRILTLYTELHNMGYAHSFEAWHEGKLVGGLYGVKLGTAFFGESMFSRMNDASKTTLVFLVYEMLKNGFTLLDTQFTTEHLKRFGVIDIHKSEYHTMLEAALENAADFDTYEGGATSESILQSFSQIS